MNYGYVLFASVSVTILLFLLWRRYERNRYRDPDTVLRDVEIYQRDPQVPDYVSAQVLRKALELNPVHRGPIEKPDEVTR